MGPEDLPYKLHISMDLALIPEEEATEDQRNAPNAAKIEIGGEEYYALMGRMKVDPIEE